MTKELKVGKLYRSVVMEGTHIFVVNAIDETRECASITYIDEPNTVYREYYNALRFVTKEVNGYVEDD